MNDERFDDLTRALGQPMPRRRALGLFGGALVAAVFGLKQRPATASPCPPDQPLCGYYADGTPYCCPYEERCERNGVCAPKSRQGDGCNRRQGVRCVKGQCCSTGDEDRWGVCEPCPGGGGGDRGGRGGEGAYCNRSQGIRCRTGFCCSTGDSGRDGVCVRC